MIQDIEPKHLDNQYKHSKPRIMDTIFLFEGSSILGKQTGNVITYPSYVEFVGKVESTQKCSIDKIYNFIYLFSVDEDKYFLAVAKNIVEKGTFQGELADSNIHKEYDNILEGYSFIGVNIFRNSLPKAVAFAAITAFHLHCWYRDNRFCGRCGKETVHDDKERMLKCPVCGNIIYPKICPAVIVAVTNGDKILLTKYVGRTYKNYALIAGFTEIGETVEETVIREVKEEVGINVKNIRYYKSQPWGLSGSLLYGFYCELDGSDDIILQEDELSVGKWVSAFELDLEKDEISLTREMICKFVEKVRGMDN